MRGPKKHWIGWKDCPQTWNFFWIAELFSSDSVCISSVEVRISELSEIRIYSDHLTDRKSMPQILILEYTIFRAFFCDFHHFPLHFPHHFPHYVPQQYFLHFWQLFCTIKRVQKSKKDNSQRKDENDEENEEENDENLWPTEASKLRSFEAFVTEIEISIFSFENSTLMIIKWKVEKGLWIWTIFKKFHQQVMYLKYK